MSRSLYLGRSGLGKTTLMVKKLLEVIEKHGKENIHIYLCSPTAMKDKAYKPLLKYITKYYSDMDENIALDLWNVVTKNRRKGMLFLLFDDLGENWFLKHHHKGNYLRPIIVSARHFHVNVVFLCQSITQPLVILRKNVDFIYCFKLDDKDEKSNFHKWFCGDLTNKQFDSLTSRAWGEKWGYLKIDRRDAHDKKYYLTERKINPDEI